MSLLGLSLGDGAFALRRRLLGLIETGEFGPDGRLPPERALCEWFGVSRRTLRQVLEALEAEAVIWRQQGKGTFVGQPPDPTGLLAAEIAGETHPLEVMEARLCIEPQLAALCARRATPAELERMRALAARVVSAPDARSTELWDRALHRLIARTARNRPMLTAFALLDELRSKKAWQTLRSRARSPGTLKVVDRQHHAILDAIEAGRSEAAEAAMRDHLLVLAANLERALAGQQLVHSLEGNCL